MKDRVNVRGGIETAIHLFAKEILNKKKEIVIPSLTLEYCDFSIHKKHIDVVSDNKIIRKSELFRYMHLLKYEENLKLSIRKQEICRKQKIRFDRVEMERSLGDIIPDIILYCNETPLLVEIAVTHFINSDKKRLIQQKGISTIEIDLSHYKDKFYSLSKKEIEEIIINDISNKTWIFNKTISGKMEKIIQANKPIVEKYKIDKQREEERRKDWFSLDISKRKEIKEKPLKEYRENLYDFYLWEIVQKKMEINKEHIPIFLDLQTPGDYLFSCDRIIWQSEIFHRFIYRNKKSIVCIKYVVNWIKENSRLKLNNSYYCKYEDTNLVDVIYYYFDYLCNLGILGWKTKVSGSGIEKSACYILLKDYQNYKYMNEEEIREYLKESRKRARGEKLALIDYRIDNYKSDTINTEKMNAREEHQFDDNKGRGVLAIYNKVGICRYCGKKTDSWTVYNGIDGTCTCRECSLGQ